MARVSIEDCKKNMPNRFALVIVAANRARQLMGNSTPLINSKNKEVVIALREIAEGKVIMKGELGLAESEDQNNIDLSDFLENAAKDNVKTKKEASEEKKEAPLEKAAEPTEPTEPTLPVSE